MSIPPFQLLVARWFVAMFLFFFFDESMHSSSLYCILKRASLHAKAHKQIRLE